MRVVNNVLLIFNTSPILQNANITNELSIFYASVIMLFISNLISFILYFFWHFKLKSFCQKYINFCQNQSSSMFSAPCTPILMLMGQILVLTVQKTTNSVRLCLKLPRSKSKP